MNKYAISVNFNFNDEEILDIISSAVYDIGYWGCIDNDTNEWWEARNTLPKGYTFEDLMFHILQTGNKVLISDVEDDEETWDLTWDKLLNGIRLTIENKYWDGDLDSIDGTIGDIIFQYALFGEIVYG